MGLLKLRSNQVISCDDVVSITAALGAATLTIDVIYNVYGQTGAGAFAPSKMNIVYTRSAGTMSFTQTEAEYLSAFVSAVGAMAEGSGIGADSPEVSEKVTATGVFHADLTPVITLKKGADLA